MTHTTSVVESGVVGDQRYVVADVDITSLDNPDSESFDPDAEFNLSPAWGASVLQAENAGAYVFSVEQNSNIHVEAYGGTDPTAGTDIGVVRVRYLGDPAP